MMMLNVFLLPSLNMICQNKISEENFSEENKQESFLTYFNVFLHTIYHFFKPTANKTESITNNISEENQNNKQQITMYKKPSNIFLHFFCSLNNKFQNIFFENKKNNQNQIDWKQQTKIFFTMIFWFLFNWEDVFINPCIKIFSFQDKKSINGIANNSSTNNKKTEDTDGQIQEIFFLLLGDDFFSWRAIKEIMSSTYVIISFFIMTPFIFAFMITMTVFWFNAFFLLTIMSVFLMVSGTLLSLLPTFLSVFIAPVIQLVFKFIGNEKIKKIKVIVSYLSWVLIPFFIVWAVSTVFIGFISFGLMFFSMVPSLIAILVNRIINKNREEKQELIWYLKRLDNIFINNLFSLFNIIVFIKEQRLFVIKNLWADDLIEKMTKINNIIQLEEDFHKEKKQSLGNNYNDLRINLENIKLFLTTLNEKEKQLKEKQKQKPQKLFEDNINETQTTQEEEEALQNNIYQSRKRYKKVQNNLTEYTEAFVKNITQKINQDDYSLKLKTFTTKEYLEKTLNMLNEKKLNDIDFLDEIENKDLKEAIKNEILYSKYDFTLNIKEQINHHINLCEKYEEIEPNIIKITDILDNMPQIISTNINNITQQLTEIQENYTEIQKIKHDNTPHLIQNMIKKIETYKEKNEQNIYSLFKIQEDLQETKTKIKEKLNTYDTKYKTKTHSVKNIFQETLFIAENLSNKIDFQNIHIYQNNINKILNNIKKIQNILEKEPKKKQDAIVKKFINIIKHIRNLKKILLFVLKIILFFAIIMISFIIFPSIVFSVMFTGIVYLLGEQIAGHLKDKKTDFIKLAINICLMHLALKRIILIKNLNNINIILIQFTYIFVQTNILQNIQQKKSVKNKNIQKHTKIQDLTKNYKNIIKLQEQIQIQKQIKKTQIPKQQVKRERN